jgi:hypothetical protein
MIQTIGSKREQQKVQEITDQLSAIGLGSIKDEVSLHNFYLNNSKFIF